MERSGRRDVVHVGLACPQVEVHPVQDRSAVAGGVEWAAAGPAVAGGQRSAAGTVARPLGLVRGPAPDRSNSEVGGTTSPSR